MKDTAMGLVARLLPPDPPDLARRLAKLASERAAEVGLTTLHDVAISAEEMRGYQEADALGWLKVRVRLAVTPISPWWGVWSGVARKELLTGDVLAPEERLPVRDVLRMYTGNGAWLGFEEGRLGVLAPGAFADLIVVDRNVLAVPADELKDVKVLQTFIDGEVVFEPR